MPNWPKPAQTSPNQPEFHILFHKMSPPQDFIRGTLILAMLEWPDNSAEIHLEKRSRKNNICVTLILPYI